MRKILWVSPPFEPPLSDQSALAAIPQPQPKNRYRTWKRLNTKVSYFIGNSISLSSFFCSENRRPTPAHCPRVRPNSITNSLLHGSHSSSRETIFFLQVLRLKIRSTGEDLDGDISFSANLPRQALHKRLD
ncbi:MAG: hypothetical protein C4520_02500 [Candidatus Abyssobacteria bacterium SURF_5]|uniref:Uncharacterized protein n=1 Tax=Abyssobacteria bacterium (strain SURF_5) TaxID=2093360 RepID=A0A3A4NYC5_ABYX5|nr:MAG: hypothetical protein C4520_02500 [Candidatus Abyssubacteria bacterium SURF_5]